MTAARTGSADARVLALCHAEGFDPVTVAPAAALQEALKRCLAAYSRGDLADMAWITPDWIERATDPGRFLASTRSVVLVALPYRPAELATDSAGPARGRVAKYARGRDYHRVFEAKLRRIAAAIRSEFGAEARATVDYGPLLERPLAAVSGMGWFGKSTMLLVPGVGPWVLLGAIATSLTLEPGAPLKKTCGSCTRCVVACPTGALGSDGSVLDARLCISYHTIENRGPIPRDLRARFGDWIFGCDDCLDACPVGRSSAAGFPDLAPADLEAARPELAPLLRLDDAAFRARFQGRAIMRAKRNGLLRNVCVALGNTGGPQDLGVLAGSLYDHSPLVRGHAAWGLAELARRHGVESRARGALALRARCEHDPAVREEIESALARLSGPMNSLPEAEDGHCR